MRKMRFIAVLCVLILALALTVGCLSGCKKADAPAGDTPTTEQPAANNEPIQSNPVETYVEPEPAP